jgi:hypothetical protein
LASQEVEVGAKEKGTCHPIPAALFASLAIASQPPLVAKSWWSGKLRFGAAPDLRASNSLAKVRAVSVEDKLTNVAVRRILTSIWVDITKVHVRTTDGVIYLGGHLQRMTASHQELSETTLREMDSRLRKIATVRDVKYQLDNWDRKLTAHWQPKIRSG